MPAPDDDAAPGRPSGRRRAAGDDAGFTLIEVIVAMLVLAVGLLGLMAVQASSLGTVGLGKQRQTASQLANRVMEQMRALPYGSVTAGMRCSDLSLPAADPNISGIVVGTGGACTATFRPAYDTSINEPLTTTANGTAVAPISPHVQPTAATTVGGVRYDVRSYVTTAAGTDTGYWITVITSWQSNLAKGRTTSIAARSRLYSPQGCLATSTHPFSGPCQAFLYGNAGLVGGGLHISSSTPTVGILDGLNVTSADLYLTSVSNRMQSEQVVSAQSEIGTSGADITGSGPANQSGLATAASAADLDPGTGTANQPAAASAVTQPSGVALSETGQGAQLRLTPRPGDTGSTYSTITATGSPACTDAAGAAITSGQACSSSTMNPSGVGSAELLVPAVLGTRALTLGQLSDPAGGIRSYAARYAAPGGAHCPTAAGVGCASAGVVRSLGTVLTGALPALEGGDTLTDAAGVDLTSSFGATPPPLVTVTDYSDAASSEAGIGAAAAAVSRTGTLTYWDGASFASAPIGPAAASYTVPPVTATYGGLTITVSGSVAVGAAGAPVTGATGCLAACTTKASSGSVVATLSYTVAGARTGSFTATLNLGSLLAQTTYKAAPSA